MTPILSTLNALCGKQVTAVIAGGANGSIITLEINHRYLFTVYCAWRLEQLQSVLTGSNESPEPLEGHIPKQTKKLLHETIESVTLSDFYDVRFRFTSATVLNVFCDVTPHYVPEDYEENWVLCDQIQDLCYAIDRQFQVQRSKYKSQG